MVKGRKTVLVVDDDPMVETVIEAFAAREGCQHISYNDPKKALEFVTKHHPRIDLAIIDLTMPAMDGLRLVDELRKISTDFPIAITTGHTAVDEEEIKKHGVQRIVYKPVTKAEFIQAVNETIKSCQIGETG